MRTSPNTRIIIVVRLNQTTHILFDIWLPPYDYYYSPEARSYWISVSVIRGTQISLWADVASPYRIVSYRLNKFRLSVLHAIFGSPKSESLAQCYAYLSPIIWVTAAGPRPTTTPLLLLASLFCCLSFFCSRCGGCGCCWFFWTLLLLLMTTSPQLQHLR